MRRGGYEHLEMHAGQHSLHDMYTYLATNLADDLAGTLSHRILQTLVSVLCRSNELVAAINLACDRVSEEKRTVTVKWAKQYLFQAHWS